MRASHRTLAIVLSLLLSSLFSAAGEPAGTLVQVRDSLPAFTPQSKYEVRAVWLSTIWGLDWPRSKTEAGQKRELDRLLDTLEEQGINTLFLQVRGRGDLIYPSELEPMHPRFYSKGYDPLAYAIEACHRRGMTLHAWITTLPLEDKSYRRHLRGKRSYYDTHRRHTKHYRQKDYMDPADSLTAIHLASIARELTTKYPLEGIHLDYIRYPDFPKRFPDASDYRASRSLLPKDEWRRSNITRIVKRVHDAIQEVDSTVLLSAATIGAYDQVAGAPHIGWTARTDVYQDPVAWERAEAIDFIVTMTYTRGATFEPIICDWADKLSIPVVIGLGAFRTLREEGGWSAQQVIDQVARVQEQGKLAGTALFRARQLTDHSLGLRDELARQRFAQPVLPHAPIVESDSTLLYPRDLTITTHGDSATLAWCDPNADRSALYAVYLSTDSLPDTDHGDDLVAVTRVQSVTIPLPRAIDGERYISLEVSCYDLHTGLEAFVPGGALIYQKREEEPESASEEELTATPSGQAD